MLILFNKPYGVISQFSKHEKYSTLKDYIPHQNVYPAGRLDTDSEGLLILTDNGAFQNKISSPNHNIFKTYLVQVENIPNNASLDILSRGVLIKGVLTKPALIRKIDDPDIWPRNPSIRKRKLIPTSWLQIKISEGKNRQVRRMTAAISHPTLRLIRTQIGEFDINELKPGEYTVIER
ncbi:MAG: pseudouridine synthase [Nitrosomonadales bacterium]|jgi:23S rRNA pseudouridine2457 synthase|nr:pseudouridine synthase [Nitrosomonadales bacterium]MBT3917986.1 pseudouridine synthase [Nitrosomonadales bacterium]MBT4182991.1 pseudouridine synthase [Nitrosomonadales bacterium]MBT4571650.1 pseudouridine synthase [Nitrosomonadales bacterium]MBT4759660.1 pseudouridine synthase [Nitrosomonadales bacterium]